MKSPYQLLQESGFAQYTAMVRFHYNRDNTSLGAEKIAEMVRAIPGATRVSTVSLDKDHGIGIFSVKIISMKTPKEAFQALKQNALERYQGLITGVEVGSGTIEVKGDFILKEEKEPLKPSNLGNYVGQLLEEGLLLEVSIDELRRQFVECDPQKLTPEVFDQIVQACNNESNFATWMCKKVATGLINQEDFRLWSEIFEFFKRYKQRFEKKDINQVKTADDIQAFLTDYHRVQDEVEAKKSSGMTQKAKDETDACLLGKFKTADGKKWTAYKTVPGQWELERKIGSGTSWCTVASKYYFDYYMGSAGHDDKAYYIFINQANPKEKYQIHYGSDQCKDARDQEVDRTQDCFFGFFEYLKEKEGREFPAKTVRAEQKREVLKQAAEGIDKVASTLSNLQTQNVAGQGRIYYLNPVSLSLLQLAKLFTELGYSNSDAIKIADKFKEKDNLSERDIAVIVFPDNTKDFCARGWEKCISSFDPIGYISWDSSLPKATEDNIDLYKNIAVRFQGQIARPTLTRCDKNLPGKEKYLIKENGNVKIYKISSEDRTNGQAAKALQQLGNIESYRNGDIVVYEDNDLVQQISPRRTCIAFRVEDTDIAVLNSPETDDWVRCNAYAKIFKALADAKVLERESYYAEHDNFFKKCKAVGEIGTLDNLKSRVSKESVEGIPSGIVVGKSKDLPKFFRQCAAAELPVMYNADGSGKILVGTVDGTVSYWRPSQISYSTNITSQKEVRETNIAPQVISTFAVKYNLSLPEDVQRVLARDRNADSAPNITRLLLLALKDGTAQYIHVPRMKYAWGNGVYQEGGRGIHGTWEQLGPALQRSDPKEYAEIQSKSSQYPGATIDVTVWFSSDNPRQPWNGIIRIIQQGQVVAYACKRCSNRDKDRSSVWSNEWNVRPERRASATLEGEEIPNNYTAPQPRQPRVRQPRQQAAAAQVQPRPEIDAQVQEELNRYKKNSQNSEEVYDIPGDRASELLPALGFTNLGQLTERTIVYRIYPHKGAASHAALIVGQGQHNTVVLGYPQNGNLATAATDSLNWRKLTRQIDNSIRTFQQCHDICQELHIPIPVAIQGWLVYRGQQ